MTFTGLFAVLAPDTAVVRRPPLLLHERIDLLRLDAADLLGYGRLREAGRSHQEAMARLDDARPLRRRV